MLTLTEPGSNSRALKRPLVLLHDSNLMAGHDFTTCVIPAGMKRRSGGHRQQNLSGRRRWRAGDVLQRAMAEDPPPLIKKDQYRVIFHSEDFPTAGFGYVWNLEAGVGGEDQGGVFQLPVEGDRCGAGIRRQRARDEVRAQRNSRTIFRLVPPDRRRDSIGSCEQKTGDAEPTSTIRSDPARDGLPPTCAAAR